MPFPDLPPERIPGSPGHLNDHQIIDQGLDYIQQQAYRDDPDFPPLPDVPVLGQSGHVTAHDRILACLEYMKTHPATGLGWAQVSNTPTGTYKGDDGHTYAYYLFETDGTLTVTTAGLLEVLIVAGGSGGTRGTPYRPGLGAWVAGLHLFTPASYAVSVGKGGAAQKPGHASTLGDLYTATPGMGLEGDDLGQGVVSTITGVSASYAQPGIAGASAPQGTGDGGIAGRLGDHGGSSGVVIAKTRLN